MKKVLMITYCFPPMAVVGTYRTLKFVKFLRHFGWEPVVLTLSNPRDLAFNPELEKDIPQGVKVYRSRVLEPLIWWENLTGTGMAAEAKVAREGKGAATASVTATPQKRSLIGRLRALAAAALSTPDKSTGWMLTAVPKGLRIIRKEKIDCLYTSSPPHSGQLIGHALAKLSGLPWIADMRAPWTQNEYFDDFKTNRFFRNIEIKMELAVYRRASFVVSNSTWEGEGYRRKYADRVGDKFHPILNGYDPDDFDASQAVRYDKFTVVYVGGMYGRRNPLLFFDGLQKFLDLHPEARDDLQVKLIGVKGIALQEALARYDLDDVLEAKGFLPQREAFRHLFGADLLLLILGFDPRGVGVIPSKLSEYLAAGRPILGLVPEGETAQIIRKYEAGDAITKPDVDRVVACLEKHYQRYKNGERLPAKNEVNIIEPFTRRYQTGQLAALFDRAVNAGGRSGA